MELTDFDYIAPLTDIDDYDPLTSIDTLLSSVPSANRRYRDNLRPAFRGQIPAFPDMKPLEISDRFPIEQWVRQFPPVSDFNFVSLWSWNTDPAEGGIEVSWLNDNLVILFKDYLSDQRFYSFLGTNAIAETAGTLLCAAERDGLSPSLSLIPEIVASNNAFENCGLVVTIDPMQTDYILSTEEWTTLSGGTFRKKRNAIHHLERTQQPTIRPLAIDDVEIQRAILEVFGRWTVQADRAGQDETVLQAQALGRVFSLDRLDELVAVGAWIDGELRGFTINECLHDRYVMGHFCYADRLLTGLYPYLLRETCRVLNGMNYRFLNTMQHLGQVGMMQSKIGNRPHHFLHKVDLTRASDAVPANAPRARDEKIHLVFEPALR